MKGRFFRIFEIFNKRNTEYYRQAFERLERENKTTFNFAAAFGSSAWLAYRKMYGWAVLVTLICVGGGEILLAFCKDDVLKGVIWFIFYFLSIILFGFFGNTLYYKDIKSKIAKGYAEMEKYNSIDPIGGLILVGVIGVLCSVSLWILELNRLISENVELLMEAVIGTFFIAIPWAINYIKFRSQESVEPVKVTKESVNKYLKKADSRYLTLSMMGVVFILVPFIFVCISVLLLFLLLVVAFSHMETTDNKVIQQKQSDKVAEEVIRMPNNFKISETVVKLPAE